MKTYSGLKSGDYLDKMVSFVEELLGIEFKKTGVDRFSSFCPFHLDKEDSFRVYVDKAKGDVRFKCFGACAGGPNDEKANWDIYDLIMLRRRCRFQEAQQIWADYLGIKDFTPHQGKGTRPEPEQEPEPDEPVGFVEPECLDKDIIATLDTTARFYNDLLMSNRDRFKKIWDYLARRGVNETIIRDFCIGYAPPYSVKQYPITPLTPPTPAGSNEISSDWAKIDLTPPGNDDDYKGRALIDHFLPEFNEDYTKFQSFVKSGVVRLLNDETARGWGYYRQQILFERKDIFSRNYGDYFAGRIVFPIFDANGSPVGFVGRRPDNRGLRWIKQQTQDTAIRTKGWLYGIDKALRHIRHYRTIILVEGIFDYFAFYNLLQDQQKPVVVSTLGSHLTAEAAGILKDLGIERYIVAYDWDPAGKKGIVEVATQVGGQVFYLGGLAEGQDPYDKLKPAVNAISGFSLNRLLAGAKKAQAKTDKPVSVSFITSGPREHRSVLFIPEHIAAADRAEMNALIAGARPVEEKQYKYNVDDFLPLLTYDHANKAMLDKTLEQIVGLLTAKPTEPNPGSTFTIPTFFIRANRHTDLGPALILWLRLVIEQQSKKRRVKATDSTLAQWLNTTRATISTYKRRLKDKAYLSIQTKDNVQRLSVRFHPKAPH